MNEVKRKLVSVRKIMELLPIEGADNIEVAKIDGWQCIVKKGQFQAGDLCIYFEIDSFLPVRPLFEFLRKSSYRKQGDQEGFRIKTIRLRGVLSQGLALPLSDIPCSDAVWVNSQITVVEEGDDLTDMFEVVKWDPPIPAQLASVAKGNFPSFIKKTDQERIQNLWNKVKDSEELFEVTRKLDGMSCTFYLKDDHFGVCSRNLELLENPNNTLWKLARSLCIEEGVRKWGKNIALQGEVVGPGIQNNPEKLNEPDFYLFDIWDIENQRYYSPQERLKAHSDLRGLCSFSLMHAPILGSKFLEAFESLDALLNLVEELANLQKKDAKFPVEMEGVVFKSYDTDIRFKVICNSYLLNEK